MNTPNTTLVFEENDAVKAFKTVVEKLPEYAKYYPLIFIGVCPKSLQSVEQFSAIVKEGGIAGFIDQSQLCRENRDTLIRMMEDCISKLRNI